MYKNILLILTFFLTITTNAQEEILTFNVSQKKSNSFMNSILEEINEEDNSLSFFLVDEKKVYGYVFNNNFKIINELTSQKRSKNYEVVLGRVTSKNNSHQIYFSNKKFNKFGFNNLSFENIDPVFKEIDLELENEKYVDAITYNNKFYIITIIKDTSIFNIYSFENNNGNFKKTSVDFSIEKFLDVKDKESTLYDLLAYYSGKFDKKVDINKIKKLLPYSIDITSNNNKLYLMKNNLVLTLDENKNITQIVSINLDTFNKDSRRISKPLNEIDQNQKEANSYIYKDHIFLIAATNKRFTFQVKNYYTGIVLKNYSASEDEVISFKNSPILEKETSRNKIIESEKTKKLLKKMANGRIGISVHKVNNNYKIILGGKSIVAHDQVVEGIYLTYVHGLFDKDFNHLNGEIPDNIIDKIYAFKEDKPTRLKTVFKFKDYYILGSYFPWPHKKLRLRKFKD